MTNAPPLPMADWLADWLASSPAASQPSWGRAFGFLFFCILHILRFRLGSIWGPKPNHGLYIGGNRTMLRWQEGSGLHTSIKTYVLVESVCIFRSAPNHQHQHAMAACSVYLPFILHSFGSQMLPTPSRKYKRKIRQVRNTHLSVDDWAGSLTSWLTG